MEHPGFFTRAGPFQLGDLSAQSEARPGTEADTSVAIHDVRTLDDATNRDVAFFENPKYLGQFLETRAAACFVLERFADRAPPDTAVLLSDYPYRSFALALRRFYPDSLLPKTARDTGEGFRHGVHASAELEPGVVVEPGAAVGPEARIGGGTTIAAGACIGYRVHIGRDCYIGPATSVTHALVGNRVLLHSGVCIGQDGFGFAMSPTGHLKVPQIGRVIIQDDVEIGANSAIDRGALRDTIIGEGTKIDNLVQIGHNVVIGRHCIIVALAGISGSSELGDGVVLGGQVGIVGHVKVGSGARIAAQSGIRTDVPPGVEWGGTPAKAKRDWFREVTALKKLAGQPSGVTRKSGETDS